MASTTAKFPGTAYSQYIYGVVSISGPEYITANDLDSAFAIPEYACGDADNYTTQGLVGVNFAFSIPTGSTIDGIELVINRMSAYDYYMYDSKVQLIKGGVVGGTDKADNGATYWPSSFESRTYGGPTDLWGQSWTPADVNSSTFGAVMEAWIGEDTGCGGNEMYVNYYTIKVYYTEGSGSGSGGSSGLGINSKFFLMF